MSSYLISKATRTDLKNIGVYTQKTWGAKQRRIYIKELDMAFRFLADNPLSGTTCGYIVSGLRKHNYKSHTIFYENREGSVFIARVLHKSMDIESRLETP